PLFLIGFALVTFPGKRRLTARILYGRPLPLPRRLVSWGAGILAVVLPALLIWYVFRTELNFVRRELELPFTFIIGATLGSYLFLVVFTWLLTRATLWTTNKLLRLIPMARRRMRPWLRRRGIVVLPPRRAHPGATEAQIEQDILELSPDQQERVNRLWKWTKTWSRRIVGLVIAAAIFFWMARPIISNWHQVTPYVNEINPGRFAIASIIFAFFLFTFRAMVWRLIIRGFGHVLPVGAALRIWSTSELARYIPGSIMQVVGRAFLAKPYGITGTICSTSQILELTTFLLANIIVAVACVLWFVAKLDPAARPWLVAIIFLLPTLGVLLHPKIFYSIANAICARLKKPPITVRLSGGKLFILLLWSMLGLLVQSWAIWLLIGHSLHIKAAWWWRLAGAYCLAWSAGFLAVTNPGGLGVREVVFYYALRAVLPPEIKDLYPSREILNTYLLFLGILLRLWTIAGELILTCIAYILDYRGALNHPDAPGRKPIQTN
ncbi:MAG TPA: lysylphosphatidylglycerol synthase domain-containing protein, partial [Tepidisphaeraceae bacterium]|nr:lysylphosphatidylglycerol synthase domain-containing protein [Tepidisphaeraceae bacterium]